MREPGAGDGVAGVDARIFQTHVFFSTLSTGVTFGTEFRLPHVTRPCIDCKMNAG